MRSDETQWIARLAASPAEQTDDQNFAWLLSPTDEVILGRDAGCQIVIDESQHPAVSRSHAKVQPFESNAQIYWQVCDLNSVNGTYVNDVRLQGCQVLQNGDRIMLTRSGPEFLFECQSAIVAPSTEPISSTSPNSELNSPSVSPVSTIQASVPTVPPTAASSEAIADLPSDQFSTAAPTPSSLWSLAIPQVLLLSGHLDTVRSLQFNANGKILVSGSADKTVKLWSLDERKEIQSFVGHKLAVSAVALSPDGKLLASGSADKTIKLWKLDPHQEYQTFIGHSAGVNAIAFSPDGETLVSSGADKTIRFWNVNTGETSHSWTGHKMSITALAFSADGQTLISGSSDRTVKIWDLNSKTERTLPAFRSAINTLLLSQDQQFLIIGFDDQFIRMWNLQTEQEIYALSFSTRQGGLAISPDGRLLASSMEDHTIRVWYM